MYRTVEQIDALMDTLDRWFPAFTRVRLPERSVQGRPVYALRLRVGPATNRRAVLAVGGTHARELMNPDALVELAVELFLAHGTGNGLAYGGFSMTADEVRTLVESMDLWFLPCVNPDGRAYVMSTDDMWRKNRRDNPGTACDGVDLNRNADFVWGVAQGSTSCSPCSEVYCGPSAFSEPETRNVTWLLDTHRVVTFVDVHSYSELVLWPWGHAPTQTSDASKRFTTLPTGTCTASIPSTYQEYMTARDLQRFRTVGTRVRDAIAEVRGRQYTSQPSLDLYPTTGTLDDYAYGRHIADPALGKTYGFTFETGPWTGDARTSFHPADPEPIKRDAKAGLVTLMQQSICAIDLIGISIGGSTSAVAGARRIRDRHLVATEAGREWVTLVEQLNPEVVRAVLGRPRRSAAALRLLRRLEVLLDDPDAVIGEEDVAAARSLLSATSSKRPAPVRAAAKAAAARLEELVGRTAADAVEDLRSRGPALGKGPRVVETEREPAVAR